MLRSSLVMSLMLLAGCGETVTPTDAGVMDAGNDGGGTDGGASDGGTDAGDPGCAGAMEGLACTTEGRSCGGPCTDQCSFCNILRCSMGMWERVEAFPAPCFDCGPDRRCVAFEQVCNHSFSDVGGVPDVFTCEEIPSSCRADATCACLEMALAFDECVEPNPGELETRFFGG